MLNPDWPRGESGDGGGNWLLRKAIAADITHGAYIWMLW